MKKLLSILILLAGFCLMLPAQAQTVGTDTKILTTWTQPTQTTGAYPSCSSTVTKACIWGYTETFTPPPGATGTTVVPSCNATVTTSCIGPVGTYTWGPGGFLYCGTWNISIVTNYLDGNGTAGVSTPASTVSVAEPCPFVTPGSPKNVSAKPAP